MNIDMESINLYFCIIKKQDTHSVKLKKPILRAFIFMRSTEYVSHLSFFSFLPRMKISHSKQNIQLKY